MKLDLGLFRKRTAAPVGRPSARRSCESRKSNGTLVVNCKGCPHEQSLESTACFKGVLKALSNETGVREILLSRDWEIVYDRDCVVVMESLAEVTKFCSGISFYPAFEDCASCPSNPRTIVSRVLEMLPQSYVPAAASSLRIGTHGTACEQCVRSLRLNLVHIEQLLSEAERKVARTAFRVVSNDVIQ